MMMSRTCAGAAAGRLAVSVTIAATLGLATAGSASAGARLTLLRGGAKLPVGEQTRWISGNMRTVQKGGTKTVECASALFGGPLLKNGLATDVNSITGEGQFLGCHEGGATVTIEIKNALTAKLTGLGHATLRATAALEPLKVEVTYPDSATNCGLYEATSLNGRFTPGAPGSPQPLLVTFTNQKLVQPEHRCIPEELLSGTFGVYAFGEEGVVLLADEA